MAAVQYILGIMTSTSFTVAAMALISTSTTVAAGEKLQSTMVKIGMGYLFIAKPLLSTLAVCCSGDLGQRGGETTTRIVALFFLLSIVCNQFPKWLSAFVACSAIFAFGLAAHQLAAQQSGSKATPSQSGEVATMKKYDSNLFQRIWSRLDLKERACVAAFAVVVSLLIENFMIWTVSATYQPGIGGSPESLQDNGRIVLEKLASVVFNQGNGFDSSWMAKRTLQTLRDGLNVQYALVSSFGASLVCLELQLGDASSRRSLAGLALRALTTLASARIVRMISFSLTVLPSQVPNCYERHFPPPPEHWKEWIMVGMIPSSRGGCNDLILSGHATVTSVLGCGLTSVASDTSFSIAVWTLIALDYSIETFQGLHYSVDMWLGCIITCLLWKLTSPLEMGGHRDQLQNGNAQKAGAAKPSPINGTTAVMYALPALLSFLILTVVPEEYFNYFLIAYSGSAAVYFTKCGVTPLLQHILLCMLCFGLGTYL